MVAGQCSGLLYQQPFVVVSAVIVQCRLGTEAPQCGSGYSVMPAGLKSDTRAKFCDNEYISYPALTKMKI